MGYELAAEGLGKDGLGELVDVGFGLGVAFFDPIGKGEEGFDAADDFVLF
ncbi:MAG: hypothetical protein MZV70_72925 [Desulfobacterales bacterium]|nr:hypothetical protein [Desulfobacterales bacterium]